MPLWQVIRSKRSDTRAVAPATHRVQRLRCLGVTVAGGSTLGHAGERFPDCWSWEVLLEMGSPFGACPEEVRVLATKVTANLGNGFSASASAARFFAEPFFFE